VYLTLQVLPKVADERFGKPEEFIRCRSTCVLNYNRLLIMSNEEIETHTSTHELCGRSLPLKKSSMPIVVSSGPFPPRGAPALGLAPPGEGRLGPLPPINRKIGANKLSSGLTSASRSKAGRPASPSPSGSKIQSSCLRLSSRTWIIRMYTFPCSSMHCQLVILAFGLNWMGNNPLSSCKNPWKVHMQEAVTAFILTALCLQHLPVVSDKARSSRRPQHVSTSNNMSGDNAKKQLLPKGMGCPKRLSTDLWSETF
jgi:hypothetical protein